MLLILLSWLYIFFTSIALGIGFSRLLQISIQNVTVTGVLGLFAVSMLTSIWAIFGPIAVGFHVFFALLSIGAAYYWKVDFAAVIHAGSAQFGQFSVWIKGLFIVTFLLLLAQSATLPLMVDNETYYVQTIKWLNAYGFVPGLANLHLFFGQTSGWHIAQSAYTFSFLSERLNDLNGYVFVLFHFWVLSKLNSYFLQGKRTDLIFGLLPICYPLLFQFVSVPSPDFAVYVISFLAFSLYLELQQAFDLEKFTVLWVLVLFAAYVKLTALVLALLPIFLGAEFAMLPKIRQVGLQLLSGLVLFCFATKNIILTGYPLYPFQLLPQTDYAVPKAIMDYFFGPGMRHSFYTNTFEQSSISNLFRQYFIDNGLDSVIALATVGVLVISPLVIAKRFQESGVRNLYFLFVFLLVWLAFSSPQFRFYIHFTIFFGLVIAALIFQKKRPILGLQAVCVLVTTVVVLVPMPLHKITENTSMSNHSGWDAQQLLTPEPVSRPQRFNTYLLENLKYNAPVNPALFWQTGSGKLPTVSQEQLQYFETYFHVIPQLRNKDLARGFYAKAK